MFKGRTTYSDILGAEEGISTNILADRLKRLERDGIVVRVSEADGRQGYRLTPKGADLLPLLLDMIAWSAKYDSRTVTDTRLVRRISRDRDVVMSELRRRIPIANVKPGPRTRKVEHATKGRDE
jgi:DNA-binding HxlR family transcriptional regulator